MPDSLVLLGMIGRPHGVGGLVRVTSYTDPPEAIASYAPLHDGTGRQFTLAWRGGGIAAVAECNGETAAQVQDRNAAERLANTALYVRREQLPGTAEDEFYLADLVGLDAVNTVGERVGKVAQVHDYGAGASLEIDRGSGAPVLVPFTRVAVPVVDIGAGCLIVSLPSIVHTLPSKEAAA